MDTAIFQSIITLFQMICVIIVFAYLFTRSHYFLEVFEHRATFRTKILLLLIFGILSVYGSVSGINLSGAVLNVHDLGPIIAGFTCGPWVGIGAGLIGGAFRLTQGGPYMYAAALATILAGLLSGIIWVVNKKEFISTKLAVVYTLLIEVLLSIMQILMVTPPDQLVRIVTLVAIPMTIVNAVAVFIFSTIIHNLLSERKTRLEKERLESEMARKNAELQIAAEIQRNFLPETIPPAEGFTIAAKSIPAKEVGGDFFDVVPLEIMPMSKNQTGIMIADVSGKGVPAALFMALSRIVVRVTATWFRKPSEVLSFANPIIATNSRTGMFVTLFYGIINNAEKTLTYVNAGHNPPLVYRCQTDTLEELDATGIAVGALEDAVYTQRSITLATGDLVILYTDGITEAVNDREEMYDLPRLMALIKEKRLSSPQEIVDAIISSVFAFSRNQPQFDDITLMVVRVN
jgi:sigma-B regulation protein RsbU (phosphoserine phosphatase)